MTDLHAARQKILKDFNVPPSVMGVPDTRPLPKDARKRFERVFLQFMKQYAGRKLHAYERKILKAMMRGDIVVAPRRAGRATLKKLLSPPQP